MDIVYHWFITKPQAIVENPKPQNSTFFFSFSEFRKSFDYVRKCYLHEWRLKTISAGYRLRKGRFSVIIPALCLSFFIMSLQCLLSWFFVFLLQLCWTKLPLGELIDTYLYDVLILCGTPFAIQSRFSYLLMLSLSSMQYSYLATN